MRQLLKEARVTTTRCWFLVSVPDNSVICFWHYLAGKFVRVFVQQINSNPANYTDQEI